MIQILYFINLILLIIVVILIFICNRIEFFENNKKIPKIIHQIWIGPNKRPDIYLDTWRNDYINKFNEWNYMLWDDKKIDDLFINKQYPFNIQKLKKIYDNEKTYYGKADIARLLILYYYGGIYIDADSVWINNKKLDHLIDISKKTGLFAGYEPNKNYVANGVIGSTKKNSNILLLINKLLNMDYDLIRSTKEPWEVTGPILLNDIHDSMTKLDSIYFYPMNWHGIKDKNLHKKIKLPKESFMFQYGLSTNNLKL